MRTAPAPFLLLVAATLSLHPSTDGGGGKPGKPRAVRRLETAHRFYEQARFSEAALHFGKALRLPDLGGERAGMAVLQDELAQAGLGPLQLSPYRREYARALVVRGDYVAAAAQLQAMRGAAGALPSAALAGRFESDVLREEAHVFQCTGQLRKAAKTLKESISLLQAAAGEAGRGAPRPSDFFDR